MRVTSEKNTHRRGVSKKNAHRLNTLLIKKGQESRILKAINEEVKPKAEIPVSLQMTKLNPPKPKAALNPAQPKKKRGRPPTRNDLPSGAPRIAKGFQRCNLTISEQHVKEMRETAMDQGVSIREVYAIAIQEYLDKINNSEA